MLTANQLLAELLESLTRKIKAAGKEDDYCSITVQPGSMAVYDFGPESDCGGTAWVRLVTANPTASFPTASADVNNCVNYLAYVMEMGCIFPAPSMTDTLGSFILPTDEELFDASMRQMDEMQMMYDAMRSASIPEMIVGDYAPVGPDGGLMGGTWTVTVSGDD